MIQQHEDANV